MPEGIDWNCLSAAQSRTKDIEKSQNRSDLGSQMAAGWCGALRSSRTSSQHDQFGSELFSPCDHPRQYPPGFV